jgi:hypothetical protein
MSEMNSADWRSLRKDARLSLDGLYDQVVRNAESAICGRSAHGTPDRSAVLTFAWRETPALCKERDENTIDARENLVPCIPPRIPQLQQVI